MAEREVAIGTFNSETEAMTVAEVLLEEGIRSVMVPLGPGIGGWGPTIWRPFELRVRSNDVMRAKSVLADLDGSYY